MFNLKSLKEAGFDDFRQEVYAYFVKIVNEAVEMNLDPDMQSYVTKEYEGKFPDLMNQVEELVNRNKEANWKYALNHYVFENFKQLGEAVNFDTEYLEQMKREVFQTIAQERQKGGNWKEFNVSRSRYVKIRNVDVELVIASFDVYGNDPVVASIDGGYSYKRLLAIVNPKAIGDLTEQQLSKLINSKIMEMLDKV